MKTLTLILMLVSGLASLSAFADTVEVMDMQGSRFSYFHYELYEGGNVQLAFRVNTIAGGSRSAYPIHEDMLMPVFGLTHADGKVSYKLKDGSSIECMHTDKDDALVPSWRDGDEKSGIKNCGMETELYTCAGGTSTCAKAVFWAR